MRILVVEDDLALAAVLQRGLQEDGYTVELCADGAEAIRRGLTAQYDGIILDVMLPGTSGLEVCRELRERGIATPILMLTARDTVDDAVAGLEAGADDYLRKPFAFRELRARLQAVMRRPSIAPAMSMQIGDAELDMATREIRRNGKVIPLTNREFGVLSCLLQNPGRIVTRVMIENHVWGRGFPGLSNTVDVHIGRLRRKLDSGDGPSVIETIRSAGYRLRVP